MTNNCLHDADLLLHYYGELPGDSERARHIAACSQCGERLDALRRDLDGLPNLQLAPDPAAGTRMAARLGERQRTRRFRLPTLAGAGAVAATAFALLFLVLGQPQQQVVPAATVQPTLPDLTALAPVETDPDIDFLEELDLLENLELLKQIEGV